MHSSRYSCSRSFAAKGNQIPSFFIGIVVYTLCITSIVAMDFKDQSFSNVDKKEKERVMDEILEKINILSEDEKLQYRRDWEEFKDETNAMTANAKKTAKRLLAIADRLDQAEWDYKMAYAAGTTACVVAGVVTLTTGGVAAIGIGIAGALVNMQAEHRYTSHSAEIEEADKLLEETGDKYNAFRKRIHDTDWSLGKESVRLMYIYGLAKAHKVTSPQVLMILRELVLYSVGIPSVEKGTITLLEKAVFNLGAKTAFQGGAGGAAKAGTQATDDVLQAGAKTSTKEASKGGAQTADDLAEVVSKTVVNLPENIIVVANTALLVRDAIDLGFTIKDLVQNKGHEAAKDLREKAKEIEDAFKL